MNVHRQKEKAWWVVGWGVWTKEWPDPDTYEAREN